MNLKAVISTLLFGTALTASGDTLTITKVDDIHIVSKSAESNGVLKPNDGSAEMLEIAGFKC